MAFLREMHTFSSHSSFCLGLWLIDVNKAINIEQYFIAIFYLETSILESTFLIAPSSLHFTSQFLGFAIDKNY